MAVPNPSRTKDTVQKLRTVLRIKGLLEPMVADQKKILYSTWNKVPQIWSPPPLEIMYKVNGRRRNLSHMST